MTKFQIESHFVNEAIHTSCFNEAYNKYYRLVESIIKKYVYSYEIRLELIQDTFLKYFTSLQKGQIDNSKAYLSTTAKNTSINYLRTQKQFHQLELNKMLIYQLTHDILHLFYEYNEHLTNIQDVTSALLQESKYDTLKMFYVDECSITEIAQKRQVANGTVTSQLTRQRKLFKNELSDNY